MPTLRVAAATCFDPVALRSDRGGAAATLPHPLLVAEPRELPAAQPGDEFFRARGRLTASFAALEHQMKVLAGLLISRTEQQLGDIVTRTLPFPRLLDLVTALAAYRVGDDPRCREMKELLARAARVEDRRKGVMHGEWGPGSVAETRVRIRMNARKKNGVPTELQDTSAAEVDEIAAEATAIAAEIAKAWGRLSRERCFRGPAR